MTTNYINRPKECEGCSLATSFKTKLIQCCTPPELEDRKCPCLDCIIKTMCCNLCNERSNYAYIASVRIMNVFLTAPQEKKE